MSVLCVLSIFLAIIVSAIAVPLYISQLLYVFNELSVPTSEFETKKQLYMWFIPLYPLFSVFKDKLVKCIKTYKDLK